MNRHIEAGLKTLVVTFIGSFFVYLIARYPALLFAFIVAVSGASTLAFIYMQFLRGAD